MLFHGSSPVKREPHPRPALVISGGQTGVDRAALDAALTLGIACGGWCPRGRMAEDGPIPARYSLKETESAEYLERTERNVAEASATLVLGRGRAVGGTALTIELAQNYGRPCLMVDLEREVAVSELNRWLEAHGRRVLNIAGPRESTAPGIYQKAFRLLGEIWG